MLGKMSTIIIITLPSKQSPEKLNDLHKNRSHSVVEPEFNYRFSHLKALSCGPQILNMIDLETHKSDTILKSCPDWFQRDISFIPFIATYYGLSVLSYMELLLTGESLSPGLQWIQRLYLGMAEMSVRISDVCGCESKK